MDEAEADLVTVLQLLDRVVVQLAALERQKEEGLDDGSWRILSEEVNLRSFEPRSKHGSASFRGPEIIKNYNNILDFGFSFPSTYRPLNMCQTSAVDHNCR